MPIEIEQTPTVTFQAAELKLAGRIQNGTARMGVRSTKRALSGQVKTRDKAPDKVVSKARQNVTRRNDNLQQKTSRGLSQFGNRPYRSMSLQLRTSGTCMLKHDSISAI